MCVCVGGGGGGGGGGGAKWMGGCKGGRIPLLQQLGGMRERCKLRPPPESEAEPQYP